MWCDLVIDKITSFKLPIWSYCLLSATLSKTFYLNLSVHDRLFKNVCLQQWRKEETFSNGNTRYHPHVSAIRVASCCLHVVTLLWPWNTTSMVVCTCVNVFAASILLSDGHLQSWHTRIHKLSYKCVVRTFGPTNIYLFCNWASADTVF